MVSVNSGPWALGPEQWTFVEQLVTTEKEVVPHLNSVLKAMKRASVELTMPERKIL